MSEWSIEGLGSQLLGTANIGEWGDITRCQTFWGLVIEWGDIQLDLFIYDHVDFMTVTNHPPPSKPFNFPLPPLYLRMDLDLCFDLSLGFLQGRHTGLEASFDKIPDLLVQGPAYQSGNGTALPEHPRPQISLRRHRGRQNASKQGKASQVHYMVAKQNH